MYRRVGTAGLLLSLVISCTHPNRIARGALEKLTRNNDRFVLVFGSVSTPAKMLARPAIRFVHAATPGGPETVLWSLVITTGDRFYAVLHESDSFNVEIGSVSTAFDKIMFVRLRESEEPLAMYVGEVRMTPAENRAAQGQLVVSSVRDDFSNAQKELKRLYPRFQGEIRNLALVRDQAIQPTPQRIK